MSDTTKHCVLVTRAQHQAQRFIDCCKALGFKTNHLPCLTIEAIDTQLSRRDIQSKDLVLFTSVNAVEHAHKLMPFPWPVKATGIGEASMQRLKALGQLRLKPVDHAQSSEGFIQSLQKQKIKKLVVIKGAGGRSAIEQVCKLLSIKCTTHDVYRRQLPQYDEQQVSELLNANLPTVICTTSNEVLENLNQLIPATLATAIKSLPLIVNSQRSVELAKELGFSGDIFVADPPGNEGQLKVLAEMF